MELILQKRKTSMRVAWWHLAVLPQEFGSCSLLTLSAIFPPKLASKINQPCRLGCSPQIFFTSNLDVRCKHSGALVWGSAQTQGHVLPRHWQLFLRQNSIVLFGLLLEGQHLGVFSWLSSLNLMPCLVICPGLHQGSRLPSLPQLPPHLLPSRPQSLLHLFVYGRCYVFITILFFFCNTFKDFEIFHAVWSNISQQFFTGAC